MLALLALLIVGGGALIVANVGKDGAEAAASGDADLAPDFQVTFFDGGSFRLSDHLRDDGRPVLLNLWASWCPPCRAEMPDLSEAAERYPGVQFVGVAVSDDAGAAADFADAIGVAYPLGADRDGSVDRAYPAPGLPATYLIDGEGRMVREVFGMLTAAQVEALLAEVAGG